MNLIKFSRLSFSRPVHKHTVHFSFRKAISYCNICVQDLKNILDLTCKWHAENFDTKATENEYAQNYLN